MRTRFILLTAGSLIVTAAIAGCSSPSADPMSGMDHGNTPGQSSSSGASAEFNSADVAFATEMIPHHKQAVEMADIYLAKTGTDPAVAKLAQRIKDAQGPEITTMTGWLSQWGAAPTGESTMPGMDPSMPGMDHSMGTGMMTEDDMSRLTASIGLEASKLFLTQMTQHHTGAIEMATTESTSGKNSDAVTLAKEIVTSQSAEITEMKALLARL